MSNDNHHETAIAIVRSWRNVFRPHVDESALADDIRRALCEATKSAYLACADIASWCSEWDDALTGEEMAERIAMKCRSGWTSST
jgi:hypothetical protein